MSNEDYPAFSGMSDDLDYNSNFISNSQINLQKSDGNNGFSRAHIYNTKSIRIFTRNVYKTQQPTFQIMVEQYFPNSAGTITFFLVIIYSLASLLIVFCIYVCCKMLSHRPNGNRP